MLVTITDTYTGESSLLPKYLVQFSLSFNLDYRVTSLGGNALEQVSNPEGKTRDILVGGFNEFNIIKDLLRRLNRKDIRLYIT